MDDWRSQPSGIGRGYTYRIRSRTESKYINESATRVRC